ncbi:MAG: hypothetical protein WCF30_02585 [Terracidiphilus sp.]
MRTVRRTKVQIIERSRIDNSRGPQPTTSGAPDRPHVLRCKLCHKPVQRVFRVVRGAWDLFLASPHGRGYSWRWDGVPWYLRSGKYLPTTATEVLVELKRPPQKLFADAVQPQARSNYPRFRLSPNSAIAPAARVKLAGQEFVGEERELYLSDEQPGEETPYIGFWAMP